MERDMNYDLELARYIWSILKSNLPVLMSWGVEIETVKVIKCGLEFKVNGFKHTGKVQIVLNEGADLFEVCLIGEDGEIRDKREDIYLDMLVSEVDELVEKTDDYEKSKHSKKCTFYTLRFGCSFAAVNTIKPQLL